MWPPVVSAVSPSGPGAEIWTVPRLAEISRVSPGRYFDLQIFQSFLNMYYEGRIQSSIVLNCKQDLLYYLDTIYEIE